MAVLGISKNKNSSSIAVIDNELPIFFGISERYTRIENDNTLSQGLINDALSTHFAKSENTTLDKIAFNHNPINIFDRDKELLYASELPDLLHNTKRVNFNHHMTHVALAFQTNPNWDSATVVIIDDATTNITASIWDARYKNGKAVYKRLWAMKSPNSIGDFYGAFSEFINGAPNSELYNMMLSRRGRPRYYNELKFSIGSCNNMLDDFTAGVPYYEMFNNAEPTDIANTVQEVLEDFVRYVFDMALTIGDSTNICYAGGVAQNALVNYSIGVNNIYIPPIPGDIGTAIGAAALVSKQHIALTHNLYLGHNINPGKVYPVESALYQLLDNGIVGVAHGPAEITPHALGNRAIFCDPRGKKSKKLTQKIKKRVKNSVFRAIILEGHVDRYFDLITDKKDVSLINTASKCKFPDLFPVLTDGNDTALVQVVTAESHFGLYMLLTAWYSVTKCPVLLVADLRAPDKPIVNTIEDTDEVERTLRIPVVS